MDFIQTFRVFCLIVSLFIDFFWVTCSLKCLPLQLEVSVLQSATSEIALTPQSFGIMLKSRLLSS